jgi:leucyl aminopeptidase
MNVSVIKEINTTNSDVFVLFINEAELLEKQLGQFSKWKSIILNAAKAYEFKGAIDQMIVVPFFEQQSFHIILVGVGKDIEKKGIAACEVLRRAVGNSVKKATQCIRSRALSIVIPYFIHSPKNFIHSSIIAASMADYEFVDYKTEKSKAPKIESLVFVSNAQIDDQENILKKAALVSSAVNTTRHWIDTPPIAMTPSYLAQQAEEIAKKRNLSITVFGEQEINDMGMGGLAGVSRGSDQDCKLIILEYKSPRPSKKTIGIVGKGITFDSGGLSLKPPRSMETMKDDMAGAAAVINVIDVIAQLQPSVNVIAVAPTSENLPSGKALKPGDIVHFYNGKTAEIKNTDAEGRLILADALSYLIKHYSPDVVVDIATLTGACAYALGPFYTGLMTEHDELAHSLTEAGNRTGDLVWRLPMGPDYKKAIKSTVADISNTGDEVVRAGAITAAHFLQHFVGDTVWAHLDIAGTAFDVPNISYLRPGATGAGVRLLVDFIMNHDND